MKLLVTGGAGYGESVQRPDLYWHNNVVRTLALLEAMRPHGIPRIVFSSTAATYGEPTSMPITEETVPAPTNPYGVTKLAVDRLLEAAARSYGLGAVSLRYFNVAGAHGPYGERHDPETHLLPNLLRVVTGHPVPAVEGPRRPGDPPALVAAAEPAHRDLGWSPRRSIDDMVRDAWAFLEHRTAAPA